MADWKDALVAKTEDTTPDIDNDFGLSYDFSALGLKKVLLKNWVGTVLATLRSVFTPASSSGPASLAFHEDTDNGTNKISISAPSSIASDKTATLPDKTGVLLISGKETIYIPASAMLPATTNGPASAQVESSTNKVNYSVLDFDGTTQENAHFNIAFPKSWDEGTVTFRVFWETTNTGTNGVAWGLQGVALSDGDTIDTAYGTAVYVVDNGQSSAAKRYVSSESAAVTIGGSPAAGDIVNFRFHRDPTNGSDDMTQDARLVGIQLFYNIDAASDD